MPSMGAVRNPARLLKGCQIALGPDTMSCGLDPEARRDLHARALEHDVHGAVFLQRELDRPRDVRRFRRALQDIREMEGLEDRGRALRPARLELDAERLHGLPLLPQNLDDVERG